MGEFQIQNESHFTNLCLKIVKTHGIYSQEDEFYLRSLAKKVYHHNARDDHHFAKQFSYLLTKTKTRDELKLVYKEYQGVLTAPAVKEPANDSVRMFRNVHNKRRFGQELLSFCEEQRAGHGVYFFYDERMDLIYIGKSSEALGYRLLTSARERVEAKFVRLMFPKTKADTHIYELYYIGKLKPRLNRDCSEQSEVTITLPELPLSDLMTIYNQNGN